MPTKNITTFINNINTIFNNQKSGYNISFNDKESCIIVKHNKNDKTLEISTNTIDFTENDKKLADYFANIYTTCFYGLNENQIIDTSYIIQHIIPKKAKRFQRKNFDNLDIIYNKHFNHLTTYVLPVTTIVQSEINELETTQMDIPITNKLLHDLHLSKEEIINTANENLIKQKGETL